MYFVPIMKKVQTGQIVEFYSNSCLVKTKFGEFSCLAIKNVVVGDFVELEIIQDSKKLNGKILSILERKTKLSKSDGSRKSYLWKTSKICEMHRQVHILVHLFISKVACFTSKTSFKK